VGYRTRNSAIKEDYLFPRMEHRGGRPDSRRFSELRDPVPTPESPSAAAKIREAGHRRGRAEVVRLGSATYFLRVGSALAFLELRCSASEWVTVNSVIRLLRRLPPGLVSEKGTRTAVEVISSPLASALRGQRNPFLMIFFFFLFFLFFTNDEGGAGARAEAGGRWWWCDGFIPRLQRTRSKASSASWPRSLLLLPFSPLFSFLFYFFSYVCLRLPTSSSIRQKRHVIWLFR
jgi:hypothetical protein